jgi:hypothetical protein
MNDQTYIDRNENNVRAAGGEVGEQGRYWKPRCTTPPVLVRQKTSRSSAGGGGGIGSPVSLTDNRTRQVLVRTARTAQHAHDTYGSRFM